MNLSEKGKDLIKKYEGCRLTAYKCPSDVWTIGWGHTAGVYEGQKITQTEADGLFDEDMVKYEKPVKKYNLNQNQYDALVSFCYNCGQGALEDVMTSGDITGTMSMYKHGNNRVVLEGLVRRRKEEVELYNTPVNRGTSPYLFLNLHPHVTSWRVYRINVSPVAGNECGFLAPKRYGGLSYFVEGVLANNMYRINTESFGMVKIYAPADADSTVGLVKMY